MPEVLIPLMFFVTIIAMTKIITGYRRDRLRDRETALRPEGSSLSTSELRTLIRDAVEEAQLPLLERIEDLEGHLAHQLPPAQEAFLELPEREGEASLPRRLQTRGSGLGTQDV